MGWYMMCCHVYFRGVAKIQECLENLKDVVSPAMGLRPRCSRLYSPVFENAGYDVHMNLSHGAMPQGPVLSKCQGV